MALEINTNLIVKFYTNSAIRQDFAIPITPNWTKTSHFVAIQGEVPVQKVQLQSFFTVLQFLIKVVFGAPINLSEKTATRMSRALVKILYGQQSKQIRRNC